MDKGTDAVDREIMMTFVKNISERLLKGGYKGMWLVVFKNMQYEMFSSFEGAHDFVTNLGTPCIVELIEDG
jgi:hypothetical protein